MQWSEKPSKQTALTCRKNNYKNIILLVLLLVLFEVLEIYKILFFQVDAMH